ncbi:MAG: class I SAM-dependent methyltransferase, partial [Spirochaetaceae bacterium]
MNKDAEIVAAGYNRIAAVYNEWARTARSAERENYIRKVRERCNPGGTILDVGCGNGDFVTRHFVTDSRVVGVDVSEKQISEARRIVPEATLMRGDVRECTFEPATFDAIVS